MELEEIQQEIPEVRLKDEINILFLDMSTACTGYCLSKINFKTKSANIVNCGAIWFQKDQKNQEKYHYLYNAIVNYFNIVGQIDFCIAEGYSLNPKKRMGCAVGPELHGALQVALAEIGVGYSVIYPQSWRAALGVKKNSEGDYKKPTLDKVFEYVKVPETLKSNITGNQRTTPNDVSDVLGITIGTLKKWNFTTINFSNIKFQESIDLV